MASTGTLLVLPSRSGFYGMRRVSCTRAGADKRKRKCKSKCAAAAGRQGPGPGYASSHSYGRCYGWIMRADDQISSNRVMPIGVKVRKDASKDARYVSTTRGSRITDRRRKQ
jgi:hypothetical protein